jgi:hypothetical protein
VIGSQTRAGFREVSTKRLSRNNLTGSNDLIARRPLDLAWLFVAISNS